MHGCSLRFVRPSFLIIHVDINQTVIAGDGAKGFTANHTLQLAASKYIKDRNGVAFYKTFERANPKALKHEVEELVLNAIRKGDVDGDDVIRNIKTTATRYDSGCVSIPVSATASTLVFSTFLHLLRSVASDSRILKCLVVFRTNGPDMGDLLHALKRHSYLSHGQWYGYGELQYTNAVMTVNNFSKFDENQRRRLFGLCKDGKPIFETEVLYNPGYDPSSSVLDSGFLSWPGTRCMKFAETSKLFTSILNKEGSPKIQFAGLREVFSVWQRFNRYHGKPFIYDEGATGMTAEDPVQLFLDDNAYEEVEKGRPGPYIITVLRPVPNEGTFLEFVPVHENCPAVIRPDKERAYTEEDYYAKLLLIR
jgi:hypothetical protein